MKILQTTWHYKFYNFILDKTFIIGADYERRPKSLCLYFWHWISAPAVFVFSWTIFPLVMLLILIGFSPVIFWFYIEDKPPDKTNVFIDTCIAIKNKVCPKIDYD